MKTPIIMGVALYIALASSADAAPKIKFGGPFDGNYRSDGTFKPYRWPGGSHIFVDPRSNESPFVNRRSRSRTNPYRIPGYRSQFDSDED